MIDKNNLTDRFDEAYQLCKDILVGLINAIETTEVTEERQITKCLLFYDKYTDRWDYTCSACSQSVYSSYSDDELKFCPYCGAKYEKIERMD